jgi:hypothetical protein
MCAFQSMLKSLTATCVIYKLRCLLLYTRHQQFSKGIEYLELFHDTRTRCSMYKQKVARRSTSLLGTPHLVIDAIPKARNGAENGGPKRLEVFEEARHVTGVKPDGGAAIGGRNSVDTLIDMRQG